MGNVFPLAGICFAVTVSVGVLLVNLGSGAFTLSALVGLASGNLLLILFLVRTGFVYIGHS
jgi:hypothetical protein